jgi:hypothetical protein
MNDDDFEFEPFCIDEIENAELMMDITEDIDEEIEEHIRIKKRIFQNN